MSERGSPKLSPRPKAPAVPARQNQSPRTRPQRGGERSSADRTSSKRGRESPRGNGDTRANDMHHEDRNGDGAVIKTEREDSLDALAADFAPRQTRGSLLGELDAAAAAAGVGDAATHHHGERGVRTGVVVKQEYCSDGDGDDNNDAREPPRKRRRVGFSDEQKGASERTESAEPDSGKRKPYEETRDDVRLQRRAMRLFGKMWARETHKNIAISTSGGGGDVSRLAAGPSGAAVEPNSNDIAAAAATARAAPAEVSKFRKVLPNYDEFLVFHRSLSHVNLSALSNEELIDFLSQTVAWLTELHTDVGGTRQHGGLQQQAHSRAGAGGPGGGGSGSSSNGQSKSLLVRRQRAAQLDGVLLAELRLRVVDVLRTMPWYRLVEKDELAAVVAAAKTGSSTTPSITAANAPAGAAAANPESPSHAQQQQQQRNQKPLHQQQQQPSHRTIQTPAPATVSSDARPLSERQRNILEQRRQTEVILHHFESICRVLIKNSRFIIKDVMAVVLKPFFYFPPRLPHTDGTAAATAAEMPTGTSGSAIPCATPPASNPVTAYKRALPCEVIMRLISFTGYCYTARETLFNFVLPHMLDFHRYSNGSGYPRPGSAFNTFNTRNMSGGAGGGGGGGFAGVNHLNNSTNNLYFANREVLLPPVSMLSTASDGAEGNGLGGKDHFHFAIIATFLYIIFESRIPNARISSYACGGDCNTAFKAFTSAQPDPVDGVPTAAHIASLRAANPKRRVECHLRAKERSHKSLLASSVPNGLSEYRQPLFEAVVERVIKMEQLYLEQENLLATARREEREEEEGEGGGGDKDAGEAAKFNVSTPVSTGGGSSNGSVWGAVVHTACLRDNVFAVCSEGTNYSKQSSVNNTPRVPPLSLSALNKEDSDVNRDISGSNNNNPNGETESLLFSPTSSAPPTLTAGAYRLASGHAFPNRGGGAGRRGVGAAPISHLGRKLAVVMETAELLNSENLELALQRSKKNGSATYTCGGAPAPTSQLFPFLHLNERLRANPVNKYTPLLARTCELLLRQLKRQANDAILTAVDREVNSQLDEKKTGNASAAAALSGYARLFNDDLWWIPLLKRYYFLLLIKINQQHLQHAAAKVTATATPGDSVLPSPVTPAVNRSGFPPLNNDNYNSASGRASSGGGETPSVPSSPALVGGGVGNASVFSTSRPHFSPNTNSNISSSNNNSYRSALASLMNQSTVYSDFIFSPFLLYLVPAALAHVDDTLTTIRRNTYDEATHTSSLGALAAAPKASEDLLHTLVTLVVKGRLFFGSYHDRPRRQRPSGGMGSNGNSGSGGGGAAAGPTANASRDSSTRTSPSIAPMPPPPSNLGLSSGGASGGHNSMYGRNNNHHNSNSASNQSVELDLLQRVKVALFIFPLFHLLRTNITSPGVILGRLRKWLHSSSQEGKTHQSGSEGRPSYSYGAYSSNNNYNNNKSSANSQAMLMEIVFAQYCAIYACVEQTGSEEEKFTLEAEREADWGFLKTLINKYSQESNNGSAAQQNDRDKVSLEWSLVDFARMERNGILCPFLMANSPF